MRFCRFSIQIATEFDTQELRSWLEKIAQDNIAPPLEHTLKQDIATTIWRQEYGAQILVIKRYNTQNIWHAIRRSFRRSRARNCWNMSKIFALADINTPARVAVIQEWLGPFKLRSWFVNQHINGVDLDNYLYAREPHKIPKEKQIKKVYDGINSLFENLKIHRLKHGDLKATNILLSENKLYLIDLDAAHQYNFSPGLERAQRKDWLRFMKNWRQQTEVQRRFETINPVTHKDCR